MFLTTYAGQKYLRYHNTNTNIKHELKTVIAQPYTKHTTFLTHTHTRVQMHFHSIKYSSCLPSSKAAIQPSKPAIQPVAKRFIDVSSCSQDLQYFLKLQHKLLKSC